MAASDRRAFQRLQLAKPLLGLLDGQNALILDIGVGGAFIEHYGEPKQGDRFTLMFRWKGTDVEFVCEVARTTLVRKTPSADISHTGMRFVQPIGDAEVKDSELALARQVIESLSGDFEPTALASEYRRDLRALLEAKMRGEEIAVPEPVAEAPVVDLMQALKASVAAAKQRGTDEKPTRTRKAAAGTKTRSRAR